MHANIEIIRRYLYAIERDDDAALAASLHPEIVQREHPNRLVPKGVTRDLAAILDSARRGRAAVRDQRFEILTALADGDRVAVELLWTATAGIPLPPLGKAEGDTLRARFAIFVTLRDGRIVAQDNYDCFLD